MHRKLDRRPGSTTEGRGTLRRLRNHQWAQPGRPRDLFRQLGHLQGAAAALEFSPAAKTRRGSVSRPERGHQYRAGPAAFPNPRGNHSARQPHEGFPGHAGPLGPCLRLYLSRPRRRVGVPLRAHDRHARRFSARWSGRGGAFQPMAGGGVFFAAGKNYRFRRTSWNCSTASASATQSFPAGAAPSAVAPPRWPTRFGCGRNRWWWT